jgi:putative heme-binding domain-containing protein
LVEAILMPSKSIAQGFVQNIFVLDDGRVVAGFVTNEAPAEVTVRDNQGRPIRIPVESIVERSESPLSVMPEGQVNQLPVAALADLVTYLQSLGTP